MIPRNPLIPANAGTQIKISVPDGLEYERGVSEDERRHTIRVPAFAGMSG